MSYNMTHILGFLIRLLVLINDFKNAPKKSKEAKQVKLADKLYNLRDLNRCVPDGWDTERVENYFIWAQKVVNGLRNGLNYDEFYSRWLNI